MTPLTDILDYYKDVFSVRLDDGEIDSVELGKLLLVASQCEELGGKAVNIARSMLAVEGIYFWDDPECDTVPVETKKVTEINNGQSTPALATCWPNPTDGLVFLEFKASSFAGKLSVYCGDGQLLLSRDFKFQGEPISFDT